jgi:hypothetical protein
MDMRVNVYAEEITSRVEVITKEINGVKFHGVRFYLELPVTTKHPHGGNTITRGPFMHHEDDDDSSAVTFWGKKDLRLALKRAIKLLDEFYGCPFEEGYGDQ